MKHIYVTYNKIHYMRPDVSRSVLQMKKGFLRLFILSMIYRKPIHGMGIIEGISSRTQGFWEPKAGNLYPLLKELHEEGLVEYDPSEEGRKKTYLITEAGKKHLLDLMEAPPRIMSLVTQDPGLDRHPGAGPASLYGDLLRELDPEGRRERVAQRAILFEGIIENLMSVKLELEKIVAEEDGQK
jgi:DNA-binding PadR family transcriptional regulator